MRSTVVLGVVLVLATACTDRPDRQPGMAGPVGGTGSPAAPSPPSISGSASPGGTSAAVTGEPAATSRAVSEIRKTDWADSTVRGLSFCGESGPEVRFRDGSNGLDVPCLMLPRGAKPVYAEFLTEEPANAPATEDALVLVELGNPGAARQQALAPIQIGADGRTRHARAVIKGDRPSAAGDKAMTFTSYRIDAGDVITATVRTLDGRTETRRYRQNGANGDWQRI